MKSAAVAVPNRQARRHPAKTQVPATVQRRLWPMDEAAYQLGCTRKHLYEMVRAGRLATVTNGRRRYVTAEELDRFVEALRNG